MLFPVCCSLRSSAWPSRRYRLANRDYTHTHKNLRLWEAACNPCPFQGYTSEYLNLFLWEAGEGKAQGRSTGTTPVTGLLGTHRLDLKGPSLRVYSIFRHIISSSPEYPTPLPKPPVRGKAREECTDSTSIFHSSWKCHLLSSLRSILLCVWCSLVGIQKALNATLRTATNMGLVLKRQQIF